MLKQPKRIIVCEKSEERRDFVQEHYPDVLLTTPEECKEFVGKMSEHGGADRVLEVAGGEKTFHLAWECARPNAIVTVVALYDQPQILPLPEMYGKNLTFKTGGVDGCDCEACGKCRILKGRDAETLYADYIEGKRSYMDITLEIRNRSIRSNGLCPSHLQMLCVSLYPSTF